MCGIFGSHNFYVYEQLYNINKQRGTFSYGSVYIKNTVNPGLIKETYVRKQPSTTNLTGDYAFQQEYEQFLGHTQAPTSAQRKFSPSTSHPFNSIHYIVAHNGVLENTEQLIKENIGVHDNPVDSSVIPVLLSYVFEFNDSVHDNGTVTDTPEVKAIQEVCNMLKGTFACWIYSKLTGDTYIVRSGSTLYGNIMTGDFSSTRCDMCKTELKEGVIYCVTSEGLATCGEFESNSPFFL